MIVPVALIFAVVVLGLFLIWLSIFAPDSWGDSTDTYGEDR